MTVNKFGNQKRMPTGGTTVPKYKEAAKEDTKNK